VKAARELGLQIGGEDSRRKASTDVAAAMGVYALPSQENPSPIVLDTFENLGTTFGVLVQVEAIDHFDLVDDPFVIAYRARGGLSRAGAFDPTKTYLIRPVAERQSIRDHFVHAMFDRFLSGKVSRHRHQRRHGHSASFDNPFADAGVSLELNPTRQ
jgi:hypothetical protein